MDVSTCETHDPPEMNDQATSLNISKTRSINILFSCDPVVESLIRGLADVDFVNLGRTCRIAYRTLLGPHRQKSLRRFTLRCNGEVAERRRANSVFLHLQGPAFEDDDREHSIAKQCHRCLVPVCNVSWIGRPLWISLL